MLLTLLGYKSTGFGGSQTPIEYSWWTDSVKKFYKLPIAIDTLLAAETDLASCGISHLCYHTIEGMSSCYIDAVEGRIGPSSYAETTILDGDLYQSILTNFASY